MHLPAAAANRRVRLFTSLVFACNGVVGTSSANPDTTRAARYCLPEESVVGELRGARVNLECTYPQPLWNPHALRTHLRVCLKTLIPCHLERNRFRRLLKSLTVAGAVGAVHQEEVNSEADCG